MSTTLEIRTITQLLDDLKSSVNEQSVKFGEILEAFHERGFGFFLFFFALPMALPLPVPPGINVLLASPLLLLTAQQAMGRKTIWMPDAVKNRSLSKGKLDKIIETANPSLNRIQVLVRPRLGFITQGFFSNIIGLLGFIMALAVCVPIPLTNTVPSFGIALMAIGVLMRDGLAVLVGALIGSAWVAMLVTVTVIFGMEGVEIAKSFIKSLF